MENKEIIQKISYYEDSFPKAALGAALANRHQIIPDLLALLEKTINMLDYVTDSKRYTGFYTSLYLLAQFKEQKGFTRLVRFLSTHNDYCLGGVIEEIESDLPRLLSAMWNGNTKIASLVLSKSFTDKVKEAFLDTIHILYVQNRISHEELIKIYWELFKDLPGHKMSLWDRLVDSCLVLQLKEFREPVIEAINKKCVDVSFFPMKEAVSVFDNNVPYEFVIFRNCIDIDVFLDLPGLLPSADDWDRGYLQSFSPQNIEIIKELEFFRGYFPHNAVSRARRNPDKIIPDLIIWLEYLTEHPQITEDIDFMGYVFASFLLAEFRTKKAFPVLLGFFSVFLEFETVLMEDLLTYYSSSIIASCFNGDQQLLTSNICDQEVLSETRREFLEAFAILYNTKVISYNDFIGNLKKIAGSITGHDDLLAESWIETALQFRLKELLPQIKEILKKHSVIIDEIDINYDFCEDIMESPQAESDEADRSDFTFFDEDIIDTQCWNTLLRCSSDLYDLAYGSEQFNDISDLLEKDQSSPINPVREKKVNKKLPEENRPQYITEHNFSQPFIRKNEKTGRNDPCPCGSGKKFKKCCGKND